MNQPKSPLEQHEVAIKEIFTYDRLPAILAVLNSFRPPHNGFLREDEFTTVAYAAQCDARDYIIQQVQQFVINNNKPPIA